MEISDEQLIKLAQLAYGDPMPDTYKEACKHESGDGLADFIVIELVEGTEGEADKLGRAIELMTKAQEDLATVILLLTDAQTVGIEKAMKAWRS